MFLIILSIKGFEGSLGAHTLFIKESENIQEDYGLELIIAFMEENVDSALQKVFLEFHLIEIIFRIDICCVMIFFV